MTPVSCRWGNCWLVSASRQHNGPIPTTFRLPLGRLPLPYASLRGQTLLYLHLLMVHALGEAESCAIELLEEARKDCLSGSDALNIGVASQSLRCV